MSTSQQLLLGLEGPIVGTLLIGGATTLIAKRYQNRRLDREVRMEFISRLSEIIYTVHVELSFYERWTRHGRPPAEERDKRRVEADKAFIAQRIKLGALQTEVDAYYGTGDTPGRELHRLTDLTMLRYALILSVPQTQIEEMVAHLGSPGHSGFTVEHLRQMLETPCPTDSTIWSPIRETEDEFTVALRNAMHALIATDPITTTPAFRSTKMLTAYDQGLQKKG